MTVVVATHDRPDALAEALASLCRQTMPDWIAWVIGDQCDRRTEAVVGALADHRLRYVNLPQRCGDQSGPNNVGASLCHTPYLAFLNHDDLLLSDHLERAVATLARTGAEFYLAQSFVVPSATRNGETVDPVIVAGPRGRRRLWVASYDAPRFEPASAWVLRTDAYQRVGDWRDGFDLFRVPVVDWLLRAARAKVRTVEGEIATVVRVCSNSTPVQGPPPLQYDRPVTVLRQLSRLLSARDANAGRTWLSGRLSAPAANGRGRQRVVPWIRLRVHGVVALAFVVTGRDIWTEWCRWRGRKPGEWKRRVVRYRTKHAVPVQADLPALKRYARSVAESHDAR